MTFTLQALHDEIVNDPEGIGYANQQPASDPSNWKGDQEIADLLNNASGANPFTVTRDRVMTADMRAAITFNAMDGLTASEETWLRWLTSGSEEIQVRPHLLADLAGIGGTSRWAVADRTAMEAAMASLMQFSGSRAEALWGEGFSVSASQVGQAANV